MPTVWRITTQRFAASAFSGEGARLYGGRWTPIVWAVVYTAESQSLALLELMVQDDPLRAHYVLMAAEIPAEMAQTRIEAQQLPGDWRTLGARDVLQDLGATTCSTRATATLRTSASARRSHCRPIRACCAIWGRSSHGAAFLIQCGRALSCFH